MDINEMIQNHGVGCFDNLVEKFSDSEIDEMCGDIIREDFKNEFSYKRCVVFTYIKEWLIENIDNACNDKETRDLFEIFCSL